jgi:bacteriorhodopsin
MTIVETTGRWSFRIQIFTGLLELTTLFVSKRQGIRLYYDLLIIELIVQAVELIFYAWMLRNLKRNITVFRYIDWFITTPVMLFTLMAFIGGDPNQTAKSFYEANKQLVNQVILLDFAMLAFGLAGELKMMPNKWAVYLGFAPLVIMFTLIYNKFKPVPMLFWYFAMVWSIYGIAALQSYERKNAMYNILDLFAKNFFGMYLAYVILVRAPSSQKSQEQQTGEP